MLPDEEGALKEAFSGLAAAASAAERGHYRLAGSLVTAAWHILNDSIEIGYQSGPGSMRPSLLAAFSNLGTALGKIRERSTLMRPVALEQGVI